MPYLGNTPSTSFATVVKDTFNGGSTGYTLSKVATTNSVSVFVENVRQEPTTAYSVSGTTLTFTATTPSGTGNIYVLHMNPTTTTTHPASQNLTAVNGTLTGTLGVTGATTTAAITASGVIKTDDTTDATSTTDGSLQTDGGLSVAKDTVIGDDLSLKSDSAVLNFGADNDVTLTHVADTGLNLNKKLGVGGATAGSLAEADDIVIGTTSATDNGLSILTANNSVGRFYFADATSGTGVYSGYIIYDHSNNNMSIGTGSATAITIDGNGKVAMPKQPVFIAKYNGFESGTSYVNPASNYASPSVNVGSHFNSSTGVFTAPIAGTYIFFGSVLSANNNTVVRVYFEKNGTITMGFQHEARTTEGYSGYDKQMVHAIISLAANDTVELVIYQDSTNTFYATVDNSYNSFSGYLIG